MKCEDVKTKLIDYYEGELQNRERDVVEVHLKECGECLTELDQFIYTLELVLRSSSVPELPDTFWSQFTTDVLHKIQQERQTEKAPLPFRFFELPYIRIDMTTLAWAAIFVFILGLLGYYGYVGYVRDQSLSDQVVQQGEERIDIETLARMFQEDSQNSQDLLTNILEEAPLEEVEDIIDYEMVLLEMNSGFDMYDIDGTEAYIESLLKDLNEKEKEALLSKLYSMI
jgi:hypothetical protein